MNGTLWYCAKNGRSGLRDGLVVAFVRSGERFAAYAEFGVGHSPELRSEVGAGAFGLMLIALSRIKA